MNKLRKFLCSVLGWHKVDMTAEGFNGVSCVEHCKYCGKRVMSDSQGNGCEYCIDGTANRLTGNVSAEIEQNGKKNIFSTSEIVFDYCPR